MSERKKWSKPVIRKIYAGSAENAKTGPNFDGGINPTHKRS